MSNGAAEPLVGATRYPADEGVEQPASGRQAGRVPWWAIVAAALAIVAFGASFAVGRVLDRNDGGSVVPALAKQARIDNGVPFVSSHQALDAVRRGGANAPVIIDLRTTPEFDIAHIAGALHVAEFQLPDLMPSLPLNRAWVLYCTCLDDKIAKRAAVNANSLGYANAVVLEHGLKGWIEAGGEVTTNGDPNALAKLGCGCNTKADAFKMWIVQKSQRNVGPRDAVLR